MALWTYALVTLDRAKRALLVSGDQQDNLLEECITEASGMVEDAWGRQIVTRGTLTEFHPRYGLGLGTDLYTNEYPIHSVTAIYEGGSGVSGTGTLLTVNTDYLLIKHPANVVRRIVSGLPVCWPYNPSSTSYRHVEIQYQAGYRKHDASTAAELALPEVPQPVVRVCLELTAWIYKQRTGHEVGMQTVSDGLGNRTFSGPAYVMPAMRKALVENGACLGPRLLTGERAA